MTKKTGPGIGKWPSRGEGWWRIFNSLKDKQGTRANILDSINYTEQKMVFRTIEAGSGLTIEVLDADKNATLEQPFTYLRLSSTIQEGINVKRNGIDFGTGPVTTLDFAGGVSMYQTAPGEVRVFVTGGDGANIDIQEAGVTKNSRPTTLINFVSGATITETVSGQVDIRINQGNFIQNNGVPISTERFETINFVATSAVATDMGNGVVSINLTNVTGTGAYTEISPYTFVYSGSAISNGQAIISGFFGGMLPEETDVVIAINGLVLEYNPDPSFSDFNVTNGNLRLNIDNLGYPVEPDDKIKGYYWTTL